MLKLLKRWLGWEADSGPFDFSALPISRGRPQSPATPSTPAPAKPQAPAARKAAPPGPADHKPKAKPRAPMDVLHNPSLTLDKPSADGFDPYNTGAFNRSASWERIGRQKKR
jgi:hypothetical protein